MKKTAAFAILLAVAVAAAVYAAESASVHSITLPVVETKMANGEGKVVTMANCSTCHSLDYILMQPKLSAAQWTGTVNKMRKVFGAEISDADAATIASYLAKHYGTGAGAAAPVARTAMAPSGEASFKKYCAGCHAGGGNVLRAEKTLHRKDLEANGVRTPADIVHILRDPGPGMPKFDEQSVPDAEARAIAEYVMGAFK